MAALETALKKYYLFIDVTQNLNGETRPNLVHFVADRKISPAHDKPDFAPLKIDAVRYLDVILIEMTS